MVLLFDALVRSKIVLLPSCPSQQILDVMLNLAEVLAVLHCVATPLVLALFCHQTTRRSLVSLSPPCKTVFSYRCLCRQMLVLSPRVNLN